MPAPGFSYRQVSDLYRQLHDAGVVSQTLPDWSTEMNRLSGSNLYDQGLHDNFIKQGSAGIDRLLEATGLPHAAGQFGRQVGGLIGAEDIGQQIGEGLPRAAINFAPLAIGAWGIPITAALSGAETYTNTGSGAAGIVSGATNALMPGVTGLAERGALRAFGGSVLEGPLANAAGDVVGQVSKTVANPFQHLGSFLAGQGAAAGLGEAGAMTQSLVDPNQEYNFDPKSALLNMTLGQLPFAAAHLAGKAVGKTDSIARMSPQSVDQLLKQSQQFISERQVRDEAAARAPIEQVPDVVQQPDPVAQDAIATRLAVLRGQKDVLVDKGDPSDAGRMSQIDDEVAGLRSQATGEGVMGESIQPESTRFPVSGTVHFENPETGYRIIRAGDDPGNAQSGIRPGQLIGYSTKFEPPQRQLLTGDTVFQIPKDFHDPNVVDNASAVKAAKAVVADPNQPELPQQSSDGLDKVREQSADFDRINQQYQALAEGDTEGLRKNIEAENGVRAKWGMEPLTDAKLKQRQDWLGTGASVADAVKGQVNDTMLRIAQKEARLKAKVDPQREADEQANEYVRSVPEETRKELMDMYTAVAGSGRPQAFSLAVKSWLDAGQPGGIDGLRSRALKAKQQGGTGAPSILDPIVEKTEAVAKIDSPATEHVRALREAVASSVTDGSLHPEDAQEFAAAYADGSLFNDPTMKEFAGQDHVKEWVVDANEEFGKMGQQVDLPQSAAQTVADARKQYLRDDIPVSKVPSNSKLAQQLASGEKSAYDFDTGIGGKQKRVFRDNLTAILPPNTEQVFHETSLEGAKALLQRTAEGARAHSGIFVSPTQDLALGQKGKGVTLVFDTERVNGFKPASLANQVQEGVGNTAAEYVIDKTIPRSIIQIIVGNERQLESLRKVKGMENKFDFANAETTDRGIVLSRKATEAPINGQPYLRPGQRMFAPQTPEDQAKVAALAFDGKGQSVVNFLKGSADDKVRAIAQDLEKNFPESLKRVVPMLIEGQSGEGFAQPFGNREVALKLSSDLMMGNNKPRQDEVVLHELMHGLTLAELDNPTKKPLLKELSDMRQRVIDQLPKNVKDLINEKIDGDWMTKYSQGEVDANSITNGDSKFNTWRPIIYGLLNDKEFVSSGFADSRMQLLLRNLKSQSQPKGNVFTRWVRQMLGIGQKVSETEMDNFLSSTSNILRQGNYVSDVSNFFDRWFAQRGQAPGEVRNNSRRALQVIQAAGTFPDSELMMHALTQEPTASPAVRDAVKNFNSMIQERGDDYQSAATVLSDLGHTPSTVNDLLTEHLTQGVNKMSDALKMLPESVTDLLFARAKDYRDVLTGVQAAAERNNEGLLNLVKPQTLHGPLSTNIDILDHFLKSATEQQQNRTALAGIVAPPDAFFDSVLRVPSPALGALTKQIGKDVSANGIDDFQKWLSPMAQMARSDPRLGEYYSRLMLMPAKIRDQIRASTKVLGRDIDAKGNLGPATNEATLNRLYKALQPGAVRKTIDQLLYVKNKIGGDKVQQIDYNSLAARDILNKLSPEDQKTVIELDNKIAMSKVAQDQQSLEAYRQILAHGPARNLMLDEGLKVKPALDAADQVFSALSANWQNPQEAAQANAQLTTVAAKMQPAAFNRLLEGVQTGVDQHKLLTQYMADNPGWVSARRNGDFLFEYFKNGEMKLGSADTKKEAQAQAGTAEIKNWRANEKDPDSFLDFGNATTEQVARMRELEGKQRQSLQQSGATPEQLAQFDKMSLVSQVEREGNIAGRSGGDMPLAGRTLSRGSDELPWFSNHINYIERNAAYWQRRLMRETADTLAAEPGTKGTDAADLIQQHMEQFMAKDPEVARVIQKVASSWSLGFNFAGNIANTTQTFMRGIPELIGLGHGAVGALRELTGAWADIAGKRLEDKPWQTPQEAQFITDAKHDGMLDPTMRDDEAKADEKAAVNFKRVLNSDKPLTLGQYVGKAASGYTSAGMGLWRMGDYANNMAQLLATFRTLQKTHPEMTYPEMKKQAYLVNASVNDVGGRANRPVGPFSGQGQVAQTLAMTMLSLKSYSLGSTMQLIRNLKAGFFRPEGATPAETYAARKALVYQLGVQFAAAGALGMPFASASLALINQFFPELEVNKKVRESVSSLLGGDTENGHIMSDIALSGVPSMMGWDFQSRLNAGNILPGVSEYNGFQPEQLLGVPANLVDNFVRGGSQLAEGNPQGAYAFVPPGLKKITQLVANGGKVADYRNRPILDPTAGETLGLVLGFQPKRLVDYNVADKLAQASEHLATVRQEQENQQLAEEALKGNYGTVRSSISQQMQTDKNYNPVDAVKAIARAAEELTFPKDLRREGSRKDADSRAQLLSGFSLDSSSPSEVQRLQFRQNLQQKLGLMSSSKEELLKAQLMDQMRQQNPTATRASLSAAAAAAVRRTLPRTSLLDESSQY